MPTSMRSTATSASPCGPASARWAPVIMGMAIGAALLWLVCGPLGGLGYANDFRSEAWPAYLALLAGRPLRFLALSPPYFGSLLARAPFALLAMALGGGWRLTYLASALPCLAAPPALAVWLEGRRHSAGGQRRSLWRSPLVLVALNPLAAFSLILGHPEEMVGACLAIAAVVVAAGEGSWWLAALLAAGAVVNKPWAIVAVPVVVAVMGRHRWRAAVLIGALCALSYCPYVIVHDAGGADGVAASLAAGAGRFFFPDYLGWWLGPGAWATRHAHELLVMVAFACALLWWLVRGRGGDRQAHAGDHAPRPGQRVADGLVLLSLVLLLRAALDPWNNTYYELPFVLALIAHQHGRRWLLTRSLAFSALLTLVVWPGSVYLAAPQVRVAAFDLVALAAIALLSLRAYGPRSCLWGVVCSQLPVLGASSSPTAADAGSGVTAPGRVETLPHAA
jgi:hypothetical protein